MWELFFFMRKWELLILGNCSYCCASCGKVSGILGIWKKQLLIAKDARPVDVLWEKICLSCRLLDGTSRFKELHDIVKEAKTKLETELGPINVRGIVSRLSIAGDVLKLCFLAIEKADECWPMFVVQIQERGSLPAACMFLLEQVTPSSVVIIMIGLSNASSDDIKGYKLWYYKSREESHTKEPNCTFSRSQRRILISNLQPCTEYTFRIISDTEAGDLGHSEGKCFTKSVEIIHKNPDSPVCRNLFRIPSLRQILVPRGSLKLRQQLCLLPNLKFVILGRYFVWLRLNREAPKRAFVVPTEKNVVVTEKMTTYRK